MPHRIVVIGYPSDFGGADTELWHTTRLWRRAGWQVSFIPTWNANPKQRARLDGIGARTIIVKGPEQLSSVDGIRQSIVVSFCNGEFLKHAAIFSQLECRAVWVNCMTWAFPAELAYYEKNGPFAAYVFQSEFQKSALAPVYEKHGARADQFHLIRGAFDPLEFSFAPASHRQGEPFVLGRIARDDPDKWSSNFWPIYEKVCYGKKKARVMAWSDRLTQKCGQPPAWAEALKANQEPAARFLSSLHCLLPVNGGARENWPRAGLEAMSAGVPVVAQKDWGWCEMIEHGRTGFLGADDCELAHFAALLAHDEELRLEVALQARRRLVNVLAEPEAIIQSWDRLLRSLAPETQFAT
jgi:hypothetical protein